MDGWSFTSVAYSVEDGKTTVTKNTPGQVTVTNTYEQETGKVQVTKSFSDVSALPSGFRITNNYNSDVFTVGSEGMTGTGTESNPYTWIINDVPVGTEVTFTESGVTVDGYSVTITANGTAMAPGSTSATARVTSAAVVDGGTVPTASFVNTYEQKTVDLKIEKKVSGTSATDKEFTFEVDLTAPEGFSLASSYSAKKNGAATGDVTVSGGKVTGIKLKADETFEILGLPEGTTYTVTETNLPGGYSQGAHANASGTISSSGVTATMNNTYNATGIATFSGTKFINGRNFKAGDSATITVTADDGTPMPNHASVTVTPISGTSAGYSFDPIQYSLSDLDNETSKTFTYTVSESVFDMDGVTKDSKIYTVTVTISDNGDGNLNVVKSTNYNALNFTNTYTTSTEVPISGTKELTGKTPADGAFSFNIEAVTAGAPMPANTTVSNTGTGFSFGPIEYTLTDYNYSTSHQFVYKITEDQTGVNSGTHVKDNVLYDQGEIEVTVTLSYNEATGELTATVDKDAGTVKFTNTPQTTTVEVDKKWLLGTKDVTSTIQNASLKVALSATGWDGKNADGNDVTTVVELPNGTGSDKWSTSWTNLPKYNANGELYTYVVTESEVKVAGDDLTAASAVTVAEGKAIITNTLPPTSVEVTKTWAGGTIPERTEVEITLSATGTTESITTLLANSDIKSETVILKNVEATKTWTNLPLYDSNGNKITYSVAETKVTTADGQWTTTTTPSISEVFNVTGGTLENGATTFDNTPLTGTLEVTKELKYNGNADTTTAKGFYAAVFAGETRVTEVKTISVSNGSGTASFTGLKAGIAYTLKETDSAGNPVGDGFEYAVSYENQNFTIKRDELNKTAKITNDKNENGQLTVNKKVLYNGAVDTEAGTEAKPMEFTVAIFTKDGDTYTQVGESKVIKVVEGETTVSAIFTGLDIGTTYYVFEMDGENRVGDTFGSYTVTGSGADFTPTRDVKSAVKEIVNAQTETGSLKVIKKVQKNGSDSNVTEETSFTIGLYEVTVSDVEGNTVETETLKESRVRVITVSANSNTGEVTFDGLPIGTKYRVYEMNGDDKVAGAAHLGEYTVSYDAYQTIEITRAAKDSGQTTVTNNQETTSLKATKDWTPGTLPDNTSVEVTIKATVSSDGENVEPVEVTSLITAIGENATKTITGEATVEWTDLPKYYNGKEVTYSVAESKVTIGGTVVWDASAENAEENPFLTNTSTNTADNDTTFTNDYTDLYVQKRFHHNSVDIANWEKNLDLGTIYFKIWKTDSSTENGGYYVNEKGAKEDKVFELKYTDTVKSPGTVEEGGTAYISTGDDLHYAKHFASLPSGSYSVRECNERGTLVPTESNTAYMTGTEMDGKLQVMKNIVTSVTAAKHWDDKDTTVTTHPDVTFKLQKKVGEEGNWTDVSTLILSESNATAEGHQYKTGQATDGIAMEDPFVEWTNLPKWDIEAGAPISYRTVEVKPGDITGYNPVGTVDEDDGNVYGDPDAAHATFTNELETIEIEVKKNWEPGVPDNAEITLTLTSSADSSVSIPIKLNGKSDWPDDTTGDKWTEGTWETYTASGNRANAHEVNPGWVAQWTNLPKYTINDENVAVEIIYTVKETGTQTGFTPYYGDSATSVTLTDNTEDTKKTGELTNTQKIDLNLEKVDRNNPATKLKDAEFKLEKLVATNGTTVEVDSNFTAVTKTTGDDGITIFEDLKAGYYRITETQAPAGYVYTDKSTAYIKVDGNGVTLLKAESGKAPDAWGSLSGDEYLNFTNASNTLTVGNDAGSQLPQTGGIGTTLFTALGGLMTATAGAILTMKSYRRRKQNA